MKIIQLLVLIILTIACCVCALFLYLLWATTAPRPLAPVSESGYTIDVLAVNITILQIVLGLVGFVVTVVGLWGYAGLKSAATEAAEVEARKVINEQMIKWRLAQESRTINSQSESSGDFSTEDAPVDQAVPARQEE